MTEFCELNETHFFLALLQAVKLFVHHLRFMVLS